MNTTNIEWAQNTWNLFVGCTKVSPGCQNCYAEKFAWRLANNPKLPAKTRAKYQRVVHEGKWTGQVEFFPERLVEPLRARKPRRIFVGSMGDLFHENMKYEWFKQIMEMPLIEHDHLGGPGNIYLFLTKRVGRAAEFMKQFYQESGFEKNEVMRNVWLGVTAENQEQADKRIPKLLEIQAAKRFVSIEPMLAPVDITPWDKCDQCGKLRSSFDPYGVLNTPWSSWACHEHYNPFGGCDGSYEQHALDLVIVGGETGPLARPIHPDWVRKVRDDCQAVGVPFFFTGWGDWATVYDRDKDDPDWRKCDVINRNTPNGRWLNIAGGHGFHGDRVVRVDRVDKAKAGHLLDGREHREWPINPVEGNSK